MLQIDVISRIRSASGIWEFYTDEDIHDGFIVFSGVKSLRLDPPGFIPNDFINYLEVESLSSDDLGESKSPHLFLFRMSVGSIDEKGNTTEVLLQIEAEEIHLEGPAQSPDEFVSDQQRESG